MAPRGGSPAVADLHRPWSPTRRPRQAAAKRETNRPTMVLGQFDTLFEQAHDPHAIVWGPLSSVVRSYQVSCPPARPPTAFSPSTPTPMPPVTAKRLACPR